MPPVKTAKPEKVPERPERVFDFAAREAKFMHDVFSIRRGSVSHGRSNSVLMPGQYMGEHTHSILGSWMRRIGYEVHGSGTIVKKATAETRKDPLRAVERS